MELDCASARELVSASADDELSPGEGDVLGRHLERCADCRRFLDQIARVNRMVRVRAVGAEPTGVDLAGSVLTERRPRLGRGAWIRPALAWVGIVVAVQSIPSLVFGDLAGAPTHVARHVGASAAALATGFLVVAWRPQRAGGLLPFVGALFTATVVAATLDTLAGDRRAGAEIVHVAELAGMVLVWLVAGSPGWGHVTHLVRSHTRRAAH